MDKSDDRTTAGTKVIGDLTLDTIITRVYEGFSTRSRERISRDDVVHVVSTLDFSERRVVDRAPQLQIRRLHFTGEKTIGEVTSPINYDQEFVSGVNLILIPKNNAGKSSILKTIKFALTGDDSDYDADVRKWIRCIWLVFSLDGHLYTIMISRFEGEAQAILVPDENLRPLSEILASAGYLFFNVSGLEEIQNALQSFFFQRIGLKELSWTQRVPGEIAAAKRTATWKTYFQGLMIPDSSDRYLMCDPQHATGNQEGLIVSTFLGLHLAEPLNRLGVETALTEKQKRSQIERSDEDHQHLEQTIDNLEVKLRMNQQTLEQLNATLQVRRATVEGGEAPQRLIAVQTTLIEKRATQQRLKSEYDDLTEGIQRKRAAARRRREMAQLTLHFTGLSVTTCPNCDAGIDSAAISLEQHTHQCRLCGKPAHDADPEEVEVLQAEAAAIEAEAEYDDRGRKEIAQQLTQLRSELANLESQIEPLQEVSRQGLVFALPTPEEEAERAQLLTKKGRIQAELDIAKGRLDARQPDIDALEIRQKILDKIRELVRREADRLNGSLLQSLSLLTEELAKRIGAESITQLNCSAVGRVSLRKHGQEVTFKSVQNEGERWRIKLAFFLALMRIARAPESGHHPGVLLIDQPGTAEMSPEDFQALAAVIYQIDAEFAADLQIICCTARTEAEKATAPSKIYGPQAPPYAF